MSASNLSANTLSERYLAAKRNIFDALYSFMNEKQREAVYAVNGPLLILAGAGTGKTTVLVNRIAHIIRYGNAYYDETIPEGLTEANVSALEQSVSLPPEALADLAESFSSRPCPPWAVLTITFTNDHNILQHHIQLCNTSFYLSLTVTCCIVVSVF